MKGAPKEEEEEEATEMHSFALSSLIYCLQIRRKMGVVEWSGGRERQFHKRMKRREGCVAGPFLILGKLDIGLACTDPTPPPPLTYCLGKRERERAINRRIF